MPDPIPDLSDKINISSSYAPTLISQRADLYVTDLSPNGGRVIVKVIRGVPINDEARQTTRQDILSALRVWRPLEHDNIMPLLGVVYNIPHILSIVTPYCENGNVIDYLRKNGKTSQLKLVSGTAKGLEAIHSHGIVHQDLRGTKVLVDPGGNARITDIMFGPVLADHAFTTVNMAGVGRWQAPEVILYETESPEGPYTKASDVYAFGMLLVEMITLEKPFGHLKSDTTAVFQVVKGDRPRKPEGLEGVEARLWALAERCWAEDTEKRPDMGTVCEELQVMG